MKKNYPFFMKIPGAHLHKNLCTYLDKIMSIDGRQTDRQTDRVRPIYTPTNKKRNLAGGIIMVSL